MFPCCVPIILLVLLICQQIHLLSIDFFNQSAIPKFANFKDIASIQYIFNYYMLINKLASIHMK